MGSAIKSHPLISFFVLAYLGSWIGWSPWWLSESGIGWLPYELPGSAAAGINQLGLLAGPLLSAFLVARVAEGREGVRRLQKLFTFSRIPGIAYFFALVLVPLSVGVGYFLSGSSIDPELSATIIPAIIMTYFVYILGGPIQEEPGWRGFALPRLQKRMKPLAAALVLGTLHCFWHAPLFFTDEWDTISSDVWQLVAYLVLVLSMSVVMSWLANRSRFSLWLAVLAHNGINWSFVFVVPTLTGVDVVSTWPAAVGLSILAVLVIIGTRGRLGVKSAV